MLCTQCTLAIYSMDSETTTQQSLDIVVDLGVVLQTESAPLFPGLKFFHKIQRHTTQESVHAKELLEQLKTKHTLHLTGEYTSEEYQKLLMQFPTLSAMFKTTIISHEIQKTKISHDFFAHVFATARLQANNCIFIETNGDHAAAAQQFGQQQQPPQKVTTILYEHNKDNINQSVLGMIKTFLEQKKADELKTSRSAASAAATEHEDSICSTSSAKSSSTEPDVLAELVQLKRLLTASEGGFKNPLFETGDSIPAPEQNERAAVDSIEEKQEAALRAAVDSSKKEQEAALRAALAEAMNRPLFGQPQ